MTSQTKTKPKILIKIKVIDNRLLTICQIDEERVTSEDLAMVISKLESLKIKLIDIWEDMGNEFEYENE